MSASTLPPTHKALRQDVYAATPTVQTVPTPQPTPGSAILKVEMANVLNYSGDIYNGKRGYPYPVPLTLGSSGLGRVVALGPDAVSLKVGDLCLLDVTISARDDVGGQAASTFLSAIRKSFTFRKAAALKHESSGLAPVFSATQLSDDD
jgi:NADPH:quinone reductase-like Zn-dependent oxidoreductase